MSETDEPFDREQSRKNLEQFLSEQDIKGEVLHDLVHELEENTHRFDIGDYNDLLRAICQQYPTMDDWLMAASAAWIAVNRKRLEEGE